MKSTGKHIFAAYDSRLQARVEQGLKPYLRNPELVIGNGLLSDAGVGFLPYETGRLESMLGSVCLLTVFVSSLTEEEERAIRLSHVNASKEVPCGIVVADASEEVWTKLSSLLSRYRFVINVGKPHGRWSQLFPNSVGTDRICDMRGFNADMAAYIEAIARSERIREAHPALQRELPRPYQAQDDVVL